MYFLRHAETEFNTVFDTTGHDPNTPDSKLSPTGLRQAEKVIQKLSHLSIKKIISSPYTRTLQTAAPLAKALGLQIEAEPLVGERRLYSCDIGSPASLLKQKWPEVDFKLLEEMPNSETWWIPLQESAESLDHRVEAFFRKWQGVPEASNVLVVSHWYFIRSFSGRNMANTEWFEVRL